MNIIGRTAVILVQAYMNLKGLAMSILLINIATFIIAWFYSGWAMKYGRVHIKQSYEVLL